MANRSDRNSVLPRRYKRMLALDRYSSEAHMSDIRKIIIAAHAHEESVHKGVLAGKILYTNQKASELDTDS